MNKLHGQTEFDMHCLYKSRGDCVYSPQSCQVDLGKNPNQDHKKSQDSHFFLKKSQGVPFSEKKTGDDSPNK